MYIMSKRGQATIFIVISLVIVTIIILSLVLLNPKSFSMFQPSSARDIKENMELCLNEKLNYAIVGNSFLSQPHISMAKQYLERYMSLAALQCFASLPKNKAVTITSSDPEIRSTITFDAEELNSITSIRLKLYYPMMIKKGDKQEPLSEFSAGVSL